MSDNLSDVAGTMAARLLAAEEAIDGAFHAAAELASFMPQARRAASVSAALGQDAMASVTAALASLSQARQHAVATHNALSKIQGRLGMEERNFGGFIDKPRHRASASMARRTLNSVGVQERVMEGA